MNTVIGGHGGLEVCRQREGIVKVACDEANVEGLRREKAFLMAMRDSGYTPRSQALEIDHGSSDAPPRRATLWEEDLGETEPVTDTEVFRHHIIHMIFKLRDAGWRHGDATSANLIIRNNRPHLIDGQEAHPLGLPAPQKQPYSDSWLLTRTIGDMQVDPSRVARRWYAILSALGVNDDVSILPLKGQPLLDLGCYQGDFTAFAAVEGMNAIGVDRGGFRTGEDSLEIGDALWRDEDVQFLRRDIANLDHLEYLLTEHDQETTVLLLSTWPYVVQERGREHAERMLELIIKHAKVFFFECQLHNDGPGPDFLVTESDVGVMLHRLGAYEAEPIVTIPVDGRDAKRTVWRVRD